MDSNAKNLCCTMCGFPIKKGEIILKCPRCNTPINMHSCNGNCSKCKIKHSQQQSY